MCVLALIMVNHLPDSTEELLIASLKGDRQSQERLYKQYFGFAMSVCLRYNHNREEALEIVNDSFMKVFVKGEQYDAAGRHSSFPFKAWFRRIIVNTALDYYRSQQKHYFHENIDEAYDVSSTESNALSQLNHEELLELVQKLPSGYRLVFNLYVIEGFTHDEIAQKLQISVGTSKSNLSRARETLRKMIMKIEGALTDN